MVLSRITWIGLTALILACLAMAQIFGFEIFNDFLRDVDKTMFHGRI